MKIFKFIPFYIIFILFLSCSDTIIKEDPTDTTPDAPAISGKFKKRVLIEDYTGTWCGFCTRVSFAIDELKLITDKAVPVSIYGGRPTEPWLTPNTVALKTYFFPSTINNYPEARLNRTIPWASPQPLNLADAKNLTGNNCGLGLAINSSIINRNLSVDVKIKFAQTYTNIRLVVYVVENNLIRDQTNYYSYYGGQNPILNYVHNHVVKGSLTNVLGSPISESTLYGQIVTKNFTKTLPSVYNFNDINISNTAEIGLVAFIIDENNTVVNVRYAKINESQSFEENL